jgi:hypothetical protein
MKDAPTPPPMLFKRQEVQLTICGVDNRSFVLELEAEGEDAQVTNSKPIGSAKMAQALDVLRRMSVFCHSKGTTIPMVSYTQWRAACIKEGIYARTDLFDRAAERLFDRDYACRDDAGNVYLPEFARNTDE